MNNAVRCQRELETGNLRRNCFCGVSAGFMSGDPRSIWYLGCTRVVWEFRTFFVVWTRLPGHRLGQPTIGKPPETPYFWAYSHFLCWRPPGGNNGIEERDAWFVVKSRPWSFSELCQPGWQPLYDESILVLIRMAIAVATFVNALREARTWTDIKNSARGTKHNLPRRVASSNNPTSTSDRGNIT
jgi:hypothetical protein